MDDYNDIIDTAVRNLTQYNDAVSATIGGGRPQDQLAAAETLQNRLSGKLQEIITNKRLQVDGTSTDPYLPSMTINAAAERAELERLKLDGADVRAQRATDGQLQPLP